MTAAFWALVHAARLEYAAVSSMLKERLPSQSPAVLFHMGSRACEGHRGPLGTHAHPGSRVGQKHEKCGDQSAIGPLRLGTLERAGIADTRDTCDPDSRFLSWSRCPSSQVEEQIAGYYTEFNVPAGGKFAFVTVHGASLPQPKQVDTE